MMKTYKRFLMVVIFGFGFHHTTFSEEQLPPDIQEKWDALSARPIPEWLQDAKFGIYAHWGLYSIGHHTSEWYGKNLYNPDFQKDTPEPAKLMVDFEKTVGKLQDGFGYKDLLQFFTAENYDPAFWADLVKESGAKFAGFSIAHHDGFGLWDSDVYNWNVGKVGPQRDLYGDFVTELRKRDMKVIATSHMKRSYGWMLPPKKYRKKAREEGWDVMNPKFKEIYPSQETGVSPEEYEQHWDRCLREVISKYHPDLLWFDGGGFKNKIATDLIEDYFKQADVRSQTVHVLNKRPVSGNGKKTYNFPDKFGLKDFEHGRDRSVDLKYGFFDSMTITGGCWGYAFRNGEQSMGVEKLIMYLIDSTSRGGGILLSLGPKVDGTLPAATIQTLQKLGAWLRVNGEAIYATRKWTYVSDEDPEVEQEKYIYAATPNVDRWHFDKFKNEDIRYTRSKDGKYVYVLTLSQPRENTIIAKRFAKGQPFKIKSISLLGSDQKIRCELTSKGLVMHLPPSLPTDGALAFKLRVESLERVALEK